MEITKAGRSTFRLSIGGDGFKGKPVFNSNSPFLYEEIEKTKVLIFANVVWITRNMFYSTEQITIKVGKPADPIKDIETSARNSIPCAENKDTSLFGRPK